MRLESHLFLRVPERSVAEIERAKTAQAHAGANSHHDGYLVKDGSGGSGAGKNHFRYRFFVPHFLHACGFLCLFVFAIRD